jgi:hypothetical protein
MLIVKVELHSAVTGLVTEIARMKIVNNGFGNARRGNYETTTYRGRGADLDLKMIARTGFISNWPRQSRHVWELVMKSLHACGYRVLREKDGPRAGWVEDAREN